MKHTHHSYQFTHNLGLHLVSTLVGFPLIEEPIVVFSKNLQRLLQQVFSKPLKAPLGYFSNILSRVHPKYSFKKPIQASSKYSF